MWSPKAEGRSLINTTSFCGFSAGLCRPNHLAAVGAILVSSGFAAIFAKLELVGLRTVLQAKAQATPHSNLTALRLSIAAE
jgi:hypothetical protein